MKREYPDAPLVGVGAVTIAENQCSADQARQAATHASMVDPRWIVGTRRNAA